MDNRYYRLAFIIVCCLFPSVAWAFSPVARYDIVPYTRVEYGETLNVGVVAFSKPGIANVSFAIASGTATYTGSSPKVSSTMALNTQLAYTDSYSSLAPSWPGVWEYYVSIPSSDFSSSGTFTVTATVTDNSSNTRNLGAITLIAEHASPTRHYAYVDVTSGDDDTCNANDAVNKCETIAAAISEAQEANGGSSDGNIIYVEEGTYTLGNASASTTNDWLTITKSSTAAVSNVTINAGTLTSTNIKCESVTLTNTPTLTATMYWADKCRVTGSNRLSSTNPFSHDDAGKYVYMTDTYISTVTFGGMLSTQLVRNVTLATLGNDAFQRAYCLINVRIDGIDPTGTTQHADVWQWWGTAPSNIVLYGIFATDLNYDTLFCRVLSGSAQDIAVVNSFFEMRTWAANDSDNGGYGAFNGTWDHLLMWHNSFVVTGSESHPYGMFGTWFFDDESGVFSLTNASIVGNVFESLLDGSGNSASYLANENESGNVCENNHYYYSYADGDRQPTALGNTLNSDTYSPDSASPATDTRGYTNILDLSDTSTYVNFGLPVAASTLINRLSSNVVPCDIRGYSRDSSADTGAFEYGASGATPSTMKGVNIKGGLVH